jgi:hypothetical protein
MLDTKINQKNEEKKKEKKSLFSVSINVAVLYMSFKGNFFPLKFIQHDSVRTNAQLL